jgi:hypothetical protein
MKLFLIAVSVLSLRGVTGAQAPAWADEEWSLSSHQFLISADASKELGLTHWQRARIETISQRVFGPSGRGLSGTRWTEWYNTTDLILIPWQRHRLQQIVLQVRGPEILTMPALAAEFQLTRDQIAKMGALVDEMVGDSPTPNAPPTKVLPSESVLKAAIEKMDKLPERYRTTSQRILDLLTPDQRQKWAEMTGKPLSGKALP